MSTPLAIVWSGTLIALYAAWPAGVVLIRWVSRIRKRFLLLSATGWLGSWVDEARLPRGELLAAAFVGAIGLAAAATLIPHASP